MWKQDKEAFSISFIEEIIDSNQSDLKKAVNYYINDCKNQIVKLKNITFDQYDKLASLNVDATSLEAQIFDGETFLKVKPSENPRDLRDTINQIEEQKSQTRIDLQIAKEDLKKVNQMILDLRKSIKENEKIIDELHFKIKSAKEYYKEKIEETN